MKKILVLLAVAAAINDYQNTALNKVISDWRKDFFVEGFWYKECPDGYEQQQESCIKKTQVILTLKFEIGEGLYRNQCTRLLDK